jgi:tetratricopeptide (TPR) repeat protein
MCLTLLCCAASAAVSTGEHLFLDADAAQRAGRFADAGRLFEQCAESSEDLMPYAWSRLGQLYVLSGRGEEGLALYERVLSRFPEGPWVRLTKVRQADAFTRMGRREEARQASEAAFQGLSVHPWFMSDAAWQHAENCLALPEHRREAYRFYRHIAETTLLVALRTKATEFLLQSSDGEDRLYGIYGLIRSGNITDARKRWNLEKNPESGAFSKPEQTVLLDQFCWDTGMPFEERLRRIEDLLRQESGKFEYRVWLMLVLREQALAGNTAAAEEFAALLVRHFPEGRDGGDGYWWLSERFEKAGDTAGADRMYKRLTEACPGHVRAPRSRFNLANRARMEGKREAARSLYELLGEEHPYTPFAAEGYYRCARMAHDAGNAVLEREGLQRAAATGIEYFHAHRARYFLAQRFPEEKQTGARIQSAPGQPFLIGAPCPDETEAPLLQPLISSTPAWRRIHFLGRNGLEEGDWEALDLIMNSAPSLKKLWFPVIADAGFMRTLFQYLPGSDTDESGRIPETIRRRLDYPRAYWDLVVPVAKELNLDPYLILAVARQESVFCATIMSHAGATGVMQLMPATADWLARVDSRISQSQAANLKSPGNSIRLGAVYLERMLKCSEGNVIYALASYNAGPGNCDKWRARFPQADPEDFMEAIPFTETRDYVQKVMANYAAYLSLYPPVR